MVVKSIILDDKKFTLGIFDDPDKLLHSVETLKDKGVKIFDCFTPFPVHHLDKALGYNRSNLTIGAFLCGFLGALSGFTLAYAMNVADWPMIIGGKPNDITMFTSFIPVIFELTILFTAFGMVFMFFARSRMFHGIKEDILDVKQTDDRMVLAIDNSVEQTISSTEIMTTLKEAGAIDVKGNEVAFNTSHSMDRGAFIEDTTIGTRSKTTNTAEEIVEEVTEEVEAKVEQEIKEIESSVKKSKNTLSEEEKSARLSTIKHVLGEGSIENKDDLKKISGVGPKYESTLNGIGIYSFAQVSKMTPEAIKAVEEITNYFPGRIERDDWIGQAKKLMTK